MLCLTQKLQNVAFPDLAMLSLWKSLNISKIKVQPVKVHGNWVCNTYSSLLCLDNDNAYVSFSSCCVWHKNCKMWLFLVLATLSLSWCSWPCLSPIIDVCTVAHSCVIWLNFCWLLKRKFCFCFVTSLKWRKLVPSWTLKHPWLVSPNLYECCFQSLPPTPQLHPPPHPTNPFVVSHIVPACFIATQPLFFLFCFLAGGVSL